jgi:RNA polymerase sigma factor (sigma-70 family)
MTGELALGSIAADTVAEAAAGNSLALARIVDAYHDDMARVCYVICGDQETALEAVQAAWVIACRKLGSLRDPDRLRPWLMTIAANEVRQHLRRQRRRLVIQIDTIDAASEGADPSGRTEALDLAAALGRLTVEDRALIAMRHIAGLDSREIGEALGISPAAARSRLSRLVSRLRSELAE